MEIFVDYFDKGGVIFLILLILSIFAFTIIIYKFLEFFFFNTINLSNYKVDIKNCDDIEDLKIRLEGYSNNSSKFFLSSILDFSKIINKTKNDEKLKFYLLEEFRRSERLLPSLEIISQVSPLIGLLGTVIGMIDSFNELELGGSLVDPSILAGGIWPALLTTAMGLIVAIQALVCHYFLERKISNVQDETEALVSDILDLN